MATEETIRGFVVSELNWTQPVEELTDDVPLLDMGILDSLGIFQLISFLESEFGIEVPEEDLLPEHFGSIGQIARLVKTRQDS